MNKKIIPIFFSFLLLATFFIAPVQADRDDDVIITVKGGIRLTITIENTGNDTIHYNFTIIWKNILNRVFLTTEGEGTIPYGIIYSYGECPVKLFSKVSVHIESEGVIVEREGFAILFFVFLWPEIGPT